MTALDPVEYAVLSQSLVAAAREMGAKLVRSAYSTILREARDGSAALLDALPEPRERASGLARPMAAEVALPDGDSVRARLVDAAALPADAPLPGPALIEGYSSTTWVPPGWAATRDGAQNTLLRRMAA